MISDIDGIWHNGTYTTSLIRKEECVIDLSSFYTLNLTAFIEGLYYNGLNNMISDTVTVQLRSVTPPYNQVDIAKGILNSNGIGAFSFGNVTTGSPYYIVIKHRNSSETWSSSGVSFTSGVMSYNFSGSSGQAFGNNMQQIDTSPIRFGLYSGDVNQDEFTDLTDVLLDYNNSSEFAEG